MLNKKVLIADDSNMIRKIIKTNLEKMQVTTVLEAADGVSAENLISLNKPDVVFLDQNMPKLSGLQIVKQMRLNRSFDSVKVVIVSSRIDENIKNEFEELGVDAFIEKPFNFEEFEKVATSVLDNGQAEAKKHKIGIDIKDVYKLFSDQNQNPIVAVKDGSVVFDFESAKVYISAQAIAMHGSLYMEMDR